MASNDPLPHQTDADADAKAKDNNKEASSSDVEKQTPLPDAPCCESSQARLSAFRSLGFLDRFLAVWIFLSMLVGILLGNFVDNVGPALKKGTFVDVSVPIGMSACLQTKFIDAPLMLASSNRPARHDVSHPVQGPVREAA